MVKRMSLLIAFSLPIVLAALTVRANPPTPKPDAVKPFSAAFQPLIDKGQMAGAVTLIADKERAIHREAIGYADIATRRPMQADALFWIASMTKPITATALMLLVDEGKSGIWTFLR